MESQRKDGENGLLKFGPIHYDGVAGALQLAVIVCAYLLGLACGRKKKGEVMW